MGGERGGKERGGGQAPKRRATAVVVSRSALRAAAHAGSTAAGLEREQNQPRSPHLLCAPAWRSSPRSRSEAPRTTLPASAAAGGAAGASAAAAAEPRQHQPRRRKSRLLSLCFCWDCRERGNVRPDLTKGPPAPPSHPAPVWCSFPSSLRGQAAPRSGEAPPAWGKPTEPFPAWQHLSPDPFCPLRGCPCVTTRGPIASL